MADTKSPLLPFPSWSSTSSSSSSASSTTSISDLSTFLSEFTSTDVESMQPPFDENKWTSRAKQLYQLCQRWDLVKDHHCFWSGQLGKEKACDKVKRSSYKFKTDADVWLISRLFKLCFQLPNSMQHKQPSYAISRMFAFYTHENEVAHVYLATDKNSESSGITVGTNFWEAEFPVLRSQLTKPSHQLLFHIYNVKTKTWNRMWCDSPQWKGLTIYRRYEHPLDSKSTRSSFVHDHFSQYDYDHWRTTPPRKGIYIQTLLTQIDKWKRIAKQRREFSETKGRLVSTSDIPMINHVQSPPRVECGITVRRLSLHCNLCKKKGSVSTLFRCSGCRKAFYCGKSCQKQDWKQHQNDC